MAQTQLYTHRAQIFVKEESSQDTYITQTAADVILAEIGDTPYTINGENYAPTTIRGDFLSSDEIPGYQSAEMTFRVPMRGSGGTGPTTEPDYTEALKACGLAYAAGPPQTYTPISTFDGAGGNPGMSYSVTLLEDGVAYQMRGCFGNVVFAGEVGQPMFAEFTFMGAPVDVMDDALETVTYDTTVAPLFMGATFATNFGGAYSPKAVSNFTLDLGNQVTLVGDINDAAGVYARITSRKSFGSFDPEAALVATQDWYGIQFAGTTGTIATGAVGGTAGNQWAIDIGRSVLRPITMASNENIRKYEVPFGVSSAPADVEGTNFDVTISFT